ncbi:MAG: dual specificity protein phosphatase family protein [Roseiflexaceae bacterium]|nr:dual specificity protein phosphatase family protein [Roseiflexaceae bacterium]
MLYYHLSSSYLVPMYPLSPAQIGRFLVTQWRRAFGLNLSRLDDLLFIGGEFPCERWPALHALGIRAVLSLQGEREDIFCDPLPARTLRLEVEDFHAPSLAQLEQAVAFLRESRQRGEPTLIHCHAGVGRAPLTAAALLISEGASASAAVRRIHDARPIIRLNARQRARLAEWEQRVLRGEIGTTQ